MIAVARTFSLIGVDAEPVYVETDVRRGLPGFTIVGLPDTSVRESRERVRSALVNSGFDFPQQRITANLAPADLKKAGPGFDLAIAAALLASSGQVDGHVLERYALAGELALDGSIRAVPGALAMAEGARRLGLRGIAVSTSDASHARLVEGLEVVPIEHVSRLRELATGELPAAEADRSQWSETDTEPGPDLSDLRGQPTLRRALEISAAGWHSVLLTGPPGAGKTLAAQRLPGLLPPLSRPEALEVLRIGSACGEPPGATAVRRPFRSPHHSASARALIGGGSPPRPGEVTRAHRGVLFLDELGEFRRDALEALRQPLERRVVSISRAAGVVSMPCDFLLVAASNPCPCGHGPDSGRCECNPAHAARYASKLSGALADRIDLQVAVERPSAPALAGDSGEASDGVRERVLNARLRQEERLGPGAANGGSEGPEIRRTGRFRGSALDALRAGHESLGLSGRGWDRVMAVSRTIADLSGDEEVDEGHVSEALGLRRRCG